jgi:hypothetical protein
MTKKLLLIEGTVTEIKSDEFFAQRERVATLETLLRESLKWIGGRQWHERVHAALGEPMPALPSTCF